MGEMWMRRPGRPHKTGRRRPYVVRLDDQHRTGEWGADEEIDFLLELAEILDNDECAGADQPGRV